MTSLLGHTKPGRSRCYAGNLYPVRVVLHGQRSRVTSSMCLNIIFRLEGDYVIRVSIV